ncbi:Thiamine biosynthesis lipoprotein ApbE precursor [compost metagenome]
MDTVVDIQIVAKDAHRLGEAEAQMTRAFEAFRKVEMTCSRFSPDSELMQVCRQIGSPVRVSSLLYEPLRFALEMAKWTEGVFDPTVGRLMEDHGFNSHYLTGEKMQTPVCGKVTYRDIILDDEERTLLLRKPMVIDLGAVAKGFAIDLAARELKDFPGFIVNAGGDLYAAGMNERGKPWTIDIQHPAEAAKTIHTIEVSNQAICTSGSYERKSAVKPDTHHIIHAQTEQSPHDWVSCSVIAPFAMMADTFSTASFLLGAESGKRLIEQAGLTGIWITGDLQIERTGGTGNDN